MKMQLLFVDDQPNVLAGLRRLLHGFRDEWDMTFVQGGAEALAALEERRFDVVVTDMKMPGMSGAELLAAVRERFPETVRIVLSGQADPTDIERSIGPVHQYLSKPCDAAVLKSTIARACTLRDRLQQPGLKRVVSRISALPSVPDVLAELVHELQSEDASLLRVAELIEQDVAMSTKLLQLVNSSFFGLPRRVTTTQEAVRLLGLKVLRPIVLTAGIFAEFTVDGLRGYSLDVLAGHSLAVSRLAERIAADLSRDEHLIGDARMAGLIHDVGQLVLAANMPREFQEAIDDSLRCGVPLHRAEDALLGTNHAAIGAYLLGLWGFRDTVVEAVGCHHDPGAIPGGAVAPLTAVHAANALVNELSDDAPFVLSSELDRDYLERLGVVERVPAWRELAAGLWKEKRDDRARAVR